MKANQECCCQVASLNEISIRNVRALNRIIIELMQKYIKDDEVLDVKNLNCWPFDLDVVEFLSTTIFASSINELIKISRNLVASFRI